MPTPPAYRFERFLFIPAQRQLLADGRPVLRSGRAIDLLQALVERRERTVSKGELLDIVWPEDDVEEANLAVQVSALRKVLGPHAIATVPGRGYRFVAPLDEEPARDPARTAPDAPPVAGQPAPASPLIGRDEALAALAARVLEHPFVTVTGPGGIGKTRLALAVAQAVADRWADGVGFVEVASVTHSAQLPQAVAVALRLSLQGNAGSEQVAAALAAKSMLLLLDNAEHVIDGVVPLVRALREAAPGVHVLVTSQEATRISGEQVFRLPPLSLPGPGDAPDDRFGALALFAARARAVDRRFQLDAGNASTVADICRRLDALPLAIELAAARVELLGVNGLRDRLGERLRVLTGGARDAPRRHRTLRAALEWSHALLSPAEQAVLRRLGPFVGGFTLELAQSVAADTSGGAIDGWGVLDALGGLVDKSLVSVDPGEPVRYRLLETMRVFALEQLEAAGETAPVRTRHSRAVSDLFATVDDWRWADEGRASPGEVLERLRPEIDNARAALDWSVRSADWVTAVTLAGAGALLSVQLGLVRELLPVLRMLRSHVEGAPARAQVNLLWRLGVLGIQDGMRQEELLPIKEEAVAKARAAGYRRRLQATLASLGFTRARQGDIAAAERIGAELLSLERPDDPAYLRSLRLSVEMMIHEHRDEIEQAVASLEQQRALLLGAPDETVPLMTCESNLVMYLNSLERFEEAAAIAAGLLERPDLPRTMTYAACWAAYALAALGRTDEAFAVMRSRRREIAATPISVYSAESLAMLCLADGRLGDAVRIDAAAEGQLRVVRSKPHPATRAFRARLQAALRSANVAPADVERWRREGESLPNEAAIDLALG